MDLLVPRIFAFPKIRLLLTPQAVSIGENAEATVTHLALDHVG